MHVRVRLIVCVRVRLVSWLVDWFGLVWFRVLRGDCGFVCCVLGPCGLS